MADLADLIRRIGPVLEVPILHVPHSDGEVPESATCAYENVLSTLAEAVQIQTGCVVVHQTETAIGPSLRCLRQTRVPFHDKHVGGRWLHLRAKVIVSVDDLLPHLTAGGPY